MKIVPLCASLCLIACSQGPGPSPAPAANHVQADAGSVPPARQPLAFRHEEKTDLIEFEFGWSAEAVAVPELDRRFSADLKRERSELLGLARADKAFRDREGLEFGGLFMSRSHETAGQSNRLLSLRIDSYAFTGGAHGNAGTAALLWDRASRKQIAFADLLSTSSAHGRLLGDRWCSALDEARASKRGEHVGSGGIFDECPGLDEIAIIPADKDADGRFERLLLIASPYVAGPWAEGTYELDLAVDADLIAAYQPLYRASFEVQSGQ